jgi:phosphopantothenoylcysteine synthetase/decarboxylase
VLLMAAAVADFRPVAPSEGKIAKAGRDELVLALEPTPDVLAQLTARRRPGQVVVGFAAEHGEGAVATARRKLRAKGLDAIVVNDISRADIGFDSDHNEVTILTARPLSRSVVSREDGHDASGAEEGELLAVTRASKAQVAERILDVVQSLSATPAHATAAPLS